MKVRTPAEVIAITSVPDMVNVTTARSVAVTVPIAVSFSLTMNVEDEVNTGAVVSVTLTVLVAVPAFPEASVDV